MTQRPDETTAHDSGGGFAPHPEGQYVAICVDVVNLGMKIEQFPQKPIREVPKASLVFATGERQDDGSLTIVSQEMTVSMFEKANMRAFLESWRGRSYKAEQVEEGVPLQKLYGKPALISIEHVTTRRGRKFAKIRSIAPLPAAMGQPSDALLTEYERPAFFEERKKEYAEGVRKHRADVGMGSDDDVPLGDPPEDDDCPF